MHSNDGRGDKDVFGSNRINTGAASLRLLITGGPRTGKTTLANSMSQSVIHTDDFKGSWEARLIQTMHYFNLDNIYTIEGVTIPAALELWLKIHQDKPTDKIIFLTNPRIQLSTRQMSMKRGIETIYSRIREELRQRHVELEDK